MVLHRIKVLLTAISLTFTVSCGSKKTIDSRDGNEDGEIKIEEPSSSLDNIYGLSDNEAVKIKRHSVLQNDLSTALELSAGEICTELDGLSCIDQVHKLTLGGTSAYIDNIYEPMEEIVAPTVVAIDRIITNACLKRVELDFSGSPAIFEDLSSGNIDSEKLENTVTKLFRKAYLRNPKQSELDSFGTLLETIKSEGIPDTAKSFATASCISIFTSLEFLFY